MKESRFYKMNLINSFTLQRKTLTEIEAMGLNSQYDLANGHASHELTLSQQNIIKKLPSLWEQARQQKSIEAELLFKHAFQQLAQCPSLNNYPYFKICPTASNSI